MIGRQCRLSLARDEKKDEPRRFNSAWLKGWDLTDRQIGAYVDCMTKACGPVRDGMIRNGGDFHPSWLTTVPHQAHPSSVGSV